MVSLKNAAPNTDFRVFLNQEGSCYKNVVGTFSTNAEGNGLLPVSAPSVGTWAVVDLDAARVEQEFASGVYEH